MHISLRPIQPDDMLFLSRVYASTREEELAILDWDASQKAAFLQMQFDAQHRHYQQHFARAQFSVILNEGQAIGRIYVDRAETEIRLIDIALLPEAQNQGIGTHLLQNLLAEARASNLPIRIHVEPLNPARRLYERLGFYLLEDKGMYLFMEWSPQKSLQASTQD